MALTATSNQAPSTAAGLLNGSGPALERRLLGYDKEARRRLALAVAMGFLARALVVAQAIVLSMIVAGVFIEGADMVDSWRLLLVVLLIGILRAGASWLAETLAQRASSELRLSLYRDLLAQFDRLGPPFLQRRRTGELVSVVTSGLDDISEYIAVYQPLRALALLVPAFVFLVVLVLDPLSSLVLLATGPMLILLLVLIGSRTKESADRRLRELTWLGGYFLDVLQGLPTLKLFGRSREQIETTARLSQQYGAASLHLLRTAFETAFVLEMSTAVATALVAVETGLRLAHGSMAFETAFAVLLITPEFFQPLRQLSASYHAGASGRAAAKRLFELLDVPAPMRPPASAPRPTGTSAGIRFERVTARYGPERPPALSEVSFVARPNSITALVGHSGAGKSTVANLLLRFLEPDSGAIYFDGKSLLVWDEVAWRRHVAWLPQHAHLFTATVAENIRLGNTGACDEEVVQAARAAGLHDFIASLPDGYDTVLQESGANLSGGQRQRLGIARAYLRDAPILILDEPTAHLDVASESLLLEALKALAAGRTTVLITHRMDSARLADQTVVLDQGCIAGTGAHDDLIAGCDVYRDLVAGQPEGVA